MNNKIYNIPFENYFDHPLIQDENIKFEFYRLPKMFFSPARLQFNYDELPLGAKVLYSRLLNLIQISKYHDKAGRKYVIFPIETGAEFLSLGIKTTGEMFKTLELAHLIERSRHSSKREYLIYVKDFTKIIFNGQVRDIDSF